jgi:hypothetical protein
MNEITKSIWNKFFGKKPKESTIEQAVEQFIVDQFPEPVLDCGDLEKQMFYNLCEMFNIQPKYARKKFREYFNSHMKPNEIVIGNFKFLQGAGFHAFVYDPTEPRLQEMILQIGLRGNGFKIDYTNGIWDKQFIKLITKFSENKRIRKEQAERIKQERIRKMFTEEGEEGEE